MNQRATLHQYRMHFLRVTKCICIVTTAFDFLRVSMTPSRCSHELTQEVCAGERAELASIACTLPVDEVYADPLAPLAEHP